MTTHLLWLDDTVVLATSVPLLLLLGAWTLRVACWLCAAEAPGFGHAFLTLLAVIGANLLLRGAFYLTNTPSSLFAEYGAPTLASAAVIAVCLGTGPYAAVLVSVVHAVLTAVSYLGVLVVAESLIL